MSEVLYYTIIKGWTTLNYPIMKVTSERSNLLYGSINEVVTYKKKGDARGKFATIEEAQACKEKIKEIVERYKVQFKRLNQEIDNFHQAEIAEIDAVTNGECVGNE